MIGWHTWSHYRNPVKFSTAIGAHQTVLYHQEWCCWVLRPHMYKVPLTYRWTGSVAHLPIWPINSILIPWCSSLLPDFLRLTFTCKTQTRILQILARHPWFQKLNRQTNAFFNGNVNMSGGHVKIWWWNSYSAIFKLRCVIWLQGAADYL